MTEYWESYYAAGRSRWSGNPNASLVEEVADLDPGTALDLGCGQGGDAIWLAAQGWTVTATDIAASALELAAQHAEQAGVTVRWERHDLAESIPDGPFDLVAASFLHSPVAFPTTRVLRAAAGAVAPGGTLLIIGHEPNAHHSDLPTADEVVAELALPAEAWALRRSAHVDRMHAFAGEEPRPRTDTVVRWQRR